MEDAGFGQGDIAELAGVNRSQVNRWARGENRPTYDKALQLARRTGGRLPRVAARFMAAAGYAWDGKTEAEPGPRPLIAPEVEDAVRQHAESPEEAEALLAAMRERKLARIRARGAEPAAS
jgi:transcriptional regulator with XRE-family HTH domain